MTQYPLEHVETNPYEWLRHPTERLGNKDEKNDSGNQDTDTDILQNGQAGPDVNGSLKVQRAEAKKYNTEWVSLDSNQSLNAFQWIIRPPFP